MTKYSTSIAALIGVTLGLATVASGWILQGAPTENARPKPSQDPKLDELARTLMIRVAGDFVAFEGPEGANSGGGAVFYDEPTAYGDGLCRIRRYRFPPSLVSSGDFKRGEWPFEKLIVEDVFSVWREPGTSDMSRLAGDAACASFRDFSQTMSGDDSFAIERAVNVLGRAIQAAKSGRTNFSVTCIDRRSDPEAPTRCDGWALLRVTNVRQIRYVANVAGRVSDYDPDVRSKIYRDDIQIDSAAHGEGCGRSESLFYRLTTEQTFGEHSASGGEPRSIVIDRDIIC